MNRITSYVALAPFLFGCAGVHVKAQASECNDACLSKIMHDYLEQIPRHEPGTLPIAANVVAVEDTVPTKIGEGSWRTIEKLPAGQVVTDPTTGNVVYFGAAQKHGAVTALLLRLKVVDHKITESEMFSSGGEPMKPPAGMPVMAERPMTGLLEPDILYDTIVPQDRRATREAAIGVVNGYLEGIGKHDGKIPAFSYRCDRYSAGYKFTNNPDNPAKFGGGSCATALDGLTGQTVVNRRFVAVDVPKGLVVVMFIIPHGEHTPPGATNVAEVMKVVDSKIRSIEEFTAGPGRYPPTSGFPDE